MIKRKTVNCCVVMVSLVLAEQAGAAVALRSLGTGSEGNPIEIGTFSINGSGRVTDTGTPDYSVSGSVQNKKAYRAAFSLVLSGASVVNTQPGADLGAIQSVGMIDRDNGGLIGVRGGYGGGIESFEGVLIGIDASELPSSLAYQVVSIELRNVSTPESAMIVNRSDTTKSLQFDSSGHKDVTGLNLIVRGGTSNDEIVSVFGNDFGEGNFRIHSLKIEVVSVDGGAL